MPVGERSWGEMPAGDSSHISICISSLQETAPRLNSDKREPVKIWHQFKKSNSCQGNPSAALAAVVPFGSPRLNVSSNVWTCVIHFDEVASYSWGHLISSHVYLMLSQRKPSVFTTRRHIETFQWRTQTHERDWRETLQKILNQGQSRHPRTPWGESQIYWFNY